VPVYILPKWQNCRNQQLKCGKITRTDEPTKLPTYRTVRWQNYHNQAIWSICGKDYRTAITSLAKLPFSRTAIYLLAKIP